MATRLFYFTFTSPLLLPQIRQLKAVTGMRIGDVHNPYKDTPGNGWCAGNASLALGREEVQGEWHISAWSHDVAATDLSAVADVRDRLREVLPIIATEWEETYTYPALIEPRAQVPERQEKVSAPS